MEAAGGGERVLEWEDLDENMRACVLLYLEPRDLALAEQASKSMKRVAECGIVWATLFLRRFGSDFWGEHAGPHPYHEVGPRQSNEWQSMLPVSVFEAFIQGQPSDPAAALSGDAGAQGTSACSGLLAYVQEHQDEDEDDYGGWKRAYQRMHEMVSAWQEPCEAAVLVAGETSFARLSVITDAIKQVITTGALAFIKNSESQLSGPVESKDITSPAGNARVLRVQVPALTKWEQKYWANFCAVRRPRNWYRANDDDDGDSSVAVPVTEEQQQEEGEEDDDERVPSPSVHFRGLQLAKNPRWQTWSGHGYHYCQRLYLIFAIDCERMLDPEYQEQVFRELHGLLGEGRDQYEDGLFVNLHLINVQPEFGVHSILERLKVPLFVEPHHWCPFYAGPVVFAVSSFTMPSLASGYDESAEARQKRGDLISRCLVWLLKQPMAGRANAYLFTEEGALWLCALTDQRSDAERQTLYDQTAWMLTL